MKTHRRQFLLAALATPVAASVTAQALTATATCESAELDAIQIESEGQVPFFEHYHQILVPVAALVDPPAEGITLVTSPMDQGSYDQAGYDATFTKPQDKLNFQHHKHPVFISQQQLQQIASGAREVLVQVYSKNTGNHVHDFKITASRSALIKTQRAVKS